MSNRHATDETFAYALEPTAFHSMREALELANGREENLQDRRLGASNLHAELVEIFSELVNNAAEHGMSEAGAHAHVRFMPHRSGSAHDVVIADEGPGIRARLSRGLVASQLATDLETDSAAIGVAV